MGFSLKRDFTHGVYEELLTAILDSDYSALPVKDFLSTNHRGRRSVVFRHDVDRKPFNALKMAALESELGIQATYYFRIVKESYDERIIGEIVNLGHEFGYHYEDLSLAKGDFSKAIRSFESNLTKLKKLYPVVTICMHGSPLSRWDNRLLWSRYHYRDFGIIGEPYFDIDFSKVLYLTDTGRIWNGGKANRRDRVASGLSHDVTTTGEVISEFKNNALPEQIMINAHPQRWNESVCSWLKELVWQNTKNIAKVFLS
jgi:hypothetical protein